MEPVKVASVGLGWWGGELAEAAARSGLVDVASCYARTPRSRQEFAARFGCREASSIEEILEDPVIDGLLIATPHTHHRELIEAAAEAGKHTFVEKPLTLTVADGEACVEAAQRAGTVLQVGHHRRRQAANRRLRALLDAGDFGVVHHIDTTIHVPKYQDPPASWRGDPAESPAGGMTALGVHMLDTMQYLLGPIVKVSAYSKRVLARWDIDDITAAIFEFDSGPLGSLRTSLVVPRRCDVTVYGTELAAWSEEEGSNLYTQRKDTSSRRSEYLDPTDPLAEQLREFAECIQTGGVPETGGAEALRVVAVLEALVESTRTGQAADVPHSKVGTDPNAHR